MRENEVGCISGFRDGKGPPGKDCEQYLKTGKVKETNPPRKPPEEGRPGINPVRLNLDF